MSTSIDITVTNLILFCAVVLGLKKLIKVYKKWRVDQMLEKWSNSPKDKVILHALGRGKMIPTFSPFALKLETYLRLAKIPYELDTKDSMGPKGKIPWITFNGAHLGDSHLIIQFLNKKFEVDLNKNASLEQRSLARACRIMIEEHFHWGVKQYRWVENSAVLSQIMKFPLIFKLLIPLQISQIKKRMVNNGIGKHVPTEIYEMTEDDLQTLSSVLGNKKFFGGDEPCEDDCAIFGGIAQALWAAPGSPFERLMLGDLNNLKQYCENMKDLCWPDWENCLDRM